MSNVFSRPNNLAAMTKAYAGLKGVTVHPLHFGPQDIGGERLLAMMKVDENGRKGFLRCICLSPPLIPEPTTPEMPLYMECIMSILRSMENCFDYREFRKRITQEKLNPSQKAMLSLRLALLDSCLEGGDNHNRISAQFDKGQLSIIEWVSRRF